MALYGFVTGIVLFFLAIIADRGTPNTLESLGFFLGRLCDWLKSECQSYVFGLADRMRERRLMIETKNRSVRDSLE
jgi:hypothetical protein